MSKRIDAGFLKFTSDMVERPHIDVVMEYLLLCATRGRYEITLVHDLDLDLTYPHYAMDASAFEYKMHIWELELTARGLKVTPQVDDYGVMVSLIVNWSEVKND